MMSKHTWLIRKCWMVPRRATRAACILILAGVCSVATGSGPHSKRSVGPDLITSDLHEFLYWGASPDGTIQAYSFGTWACNIGDTPAVWDGSTDQHPVIGQNLFRVTDQRCEQIGQSWLKWGFQANNTDDCGDCNDPGTTDLLGVNCADAYSAGLNGFQTALGPKSVVNPFTGEFPVSHATPSMTTIGGRLQVPTDALNTPGATYFVEGQYVSPDDSAAGNNRNNTSYRAVWFLPGYNPTFVSPGGTPSSIVQQQPGIAAWAEQDATVFLSSTDVPGDGRLYAARKATDLGGGTWHYELVIQNVNVDRAVGGVLVQLPSGFVAANLGFHAVPYHSGEPYDAAPWIGSTTAAGVRWDTVSYATDPNANALRWGTMYNFWFDADVAPELVTWATLALFKPGAPAEVEVAIGPGLMLRGDMNCDGVVDFGDINPFVSYLVDFSTWQAAYPDCPASNGDIDEDSVYPSFQDINPFVECVIQSGCP